MTNCKTSIALGFFDGVHLAHKEIIALAVRNGAVFGEKPIVLTFDRSPSEILTGKAPQYLTTNEEKRRLVGALGAELVLLHTDGDLLAMEPTDFVYSTLLNDYNAGSVFCGYNYRFGKGGSGGGELLTKMAQRCGFRASIMPCMELNGEGISSGKIRKSLSSGNVRSANAMLGRRYSIRGNVEKGKHLGTRLSFPTANISVNDKMLPMPGVYKTVTTIDGCEYNSVTNIGNNPTIQGDNFRTETHILGFSGNLYGKELAVAFADFIRPEQKFSSLDELKTAVMKDIEIAMQNDGAIV